MKPCGKRIPPWGDEDREAAWRGEPAPDRREGSFEPSCPSITPSCGGDGSEVGAKGCSCCLGDCRAGPLVKGEASFCGGEKSGVGADSRLSSGGLGEREGGGEGAMGASVGALRDVGQLRVVDGLLAVTYRSGEK
jgi:hypothetical protein